MGGKNSVNIFDIFFDLISNVLAFRFNAKRFENSFELIILLIKLLKLMGERPDLVSDVWHVSRFGSTYFGIFDLALNVYKFDRVYVLVN